MRIRAVVWREIPDFGEDEDHKRLRAIRQALGVSLKRLYELTKEADPRGRGVSIAHLHRVEKRKAYLRSDQLCLIASVLGVHPMLILDPQEIPRAVAPGEHPPCLEGHRAVALF